MLAGINVANIYFRTTGFLIPQINIHRDIENIQHYIFAYTDSNNIWMKSYKQEILTTFMLRDCAYTTRSLNLTNVKVISNIQC